MFSVPVFRFKPQYPLGCWGTWGYSPVPAQVFSHTTPHHTTCLFPMSKQAFFWSKGHLFSQVGCYPKYARNYIWQNLSSYMISFHWFSNSSTEIRVNTKLWIFFSPLSLQFVSRDVSGNRLPYNAGFSGAVPALGGRCQLGRGRQSLSTSNTKHQHKMFSKYFLAVLFLVFGEDAVRSLCPVWMSTVLLNSHNGLPPFFSPVTDKSAMTSWVGVVMSSCLFRLMFLLFFALPVILNTWPNSVYGSMLSRVLERWGMTTGQYSL